MIFGKDPLPEDNTIIGYYNGKYIVDLEIHGLHYFEGPEGLLDFGEATDPIGLIPIDELPKSEADEIRKLFEK